MLKQFNLNLTIDRVRRANLKLYSDQTKVNVKVNIFFGVYHLFFDLFRLFFDLYRFRSVNLHFPHLFQNPRTERLSSPLPPWHHPCSCGSALSAFRRSTPTWRREHHQRRHSCCYTPQLCALYSTYVRPHSDLASVINNLFLYIRM